MHFQNYIPVDTILEAIKGNISAMLPTSKWGIDITIKPHSKQRTVEQNRLLWEIYNHIVRFYEDTGFVIDGLRLKFLNADFLHAYFKVRFGLKSSAKLNTQEFSEYIGKIQKEMVEQSNGMYEPIIPEDNYLTKTHIVEE